MGLAASQARLLLLTARKSDLEYRAQRITNTLMILAMQTESVAREYSIKVSNQGIFYIDSTSATQTSKSLNASNFASIASGAYTLQVKDGNTWRKWSDSKTYNYTTTDDAGNEIVKSINEAAFNALSDEEKAKCTANPVDGDYNALQISEGLNNGTMKIVDANGDEVAISSNNGFTESYYTDDDRAAEAEYNTKTASIQVKEKRLQNDLNQIETQQKACDTEIDSVKKVMEKNIERTFKVFS